MISKSMIAINSLIARVKTYFTLQTLVTAKLIIGGKSI